MRLIDADTAFGVLADYYHHTMPIQYMALKEALDRVPTVEAVPVVHGHWEPVTNGRGGFECSKCHHYAPSYQDGVEWLSEWCPSCGAIMNREM